MTSYPDLDPVILSLGPLEVRWYGMMYVLGFGSAWLLGRLRARQAWRGWSAGEVDDFLAWLVVGLVLGARLGYVLFYEPGHFLARPQDIIAVWKGGMSFHGGALGVLAASWLFARRRGKSLLDIGDFITPLAPPGLFFGRMGNFINNELWGRVTDAPWAVVFPGPEAGWFPRHPSQIYEALLEGVVLFVLVWVFSSRPRPRGAVSGLFLLGYGCARFLVEFFRQPDPQLGYLALGWLTMGQVLSLPMILFGAFLLKAGRRL
ncbi:MAG: prolipoprotein diacylglyceryl transferase [Desulfovibrionaceae bacterium]|nr:prolipoprotein diacylglyceryl transferase [Desulfovibrionaceae bacterium]